MIGDHLAWRHHFPTTSVTQQKEDRLLLASSQAEVVAALFVKPPRR